MKYFIQCKCFPLGVFSTMTLVKLCRLYSSRWQYIAEQEGVSLFSRLGFVLWQLYEPLCSPDWSLWERSMAGKSAR